MRKIFALFIFSFLISEIYSEIPQEWVNRFPEALFYLSTGKKKDHPEKHLYNVKDLIEVPSSEANYAFIIGPPPPDFSLSKEDHGIKGLSAFLNVIGLNTGQVFIIYQQKEDGKVRDETFFLVADLDNRRMHLYKKD